MELTISDLNSGERDWISTQIEAAADFVDAFSLLGAGRKLTLASLDSAFAAWLATDEKDTDTINTVISSVGIAFGQFLIEGLGLEWKIVTDEYGTDLAAYGFPGQGDVIICPASFVAKRWERRETNFLKSAYLEIKNQVRSIRESFEAEHSQNNVN